MEMTSKEFRHAHLLKIIEDYGSIEALATAAGMNPQHISQLKNKHRGIGDRTARKIEAAVGLPDGAMDLPVHGDHLDEELRGLFRVVPEDDAISAIEEALPSLSENGIRRLTAALLALLHTSKDS